MFADWNQMPEDLQVGLAREALNRAVEMIAEQAEALADEIERGSLTDRGGPNALRLFAAVVRSDSGSVLAALCEAVGGCAIGLCGCGSTTTGMARVSPTGKPAPGRGSCCSTRSGSRTVNGSR